VRQRSPNSLYCRGERSGRPKTRLEFQAVISTWSSWLHLSPEGGWTGVALGPPPLDVPWFLGRQRTVIIGISFFFGNIFLFYLAKKTAGFIDLNTTYCGVNVRYTTAPRFLRTIRVIVHGHCRAVGWSLVWFACTGCGTLRHTYPRTRARYCRTFVLSLGLLAARDTVPFDTLTTGVVWWQGLLGLDILTLDIVQNIVVRSVGLLCGLLAPDAAPFDTSTPGHRARYFRTFA
jgi:hypothetical protein